MKKKLYNKNSTPGISQSIAANRSAVEELEEIVENFWNILDFPTFPFSNLTSTTNGMRNFPPYNIVECNEDFQGVLRPNVNVRARLEIAVAGYNKDRLEVLKEGNILIVKGKPQDAVNRTDEMDRRGEQRPPTNIVRHQGISNIRFTRAFELNPNAQIESVELKDGILQITVFTTNVGPDVTSFPIQ